MKQVKLGASTVEPARGNISVFILYNLVNFGIFAYKVDLLFFVVLHRAVQCYGQLSLLQ